MFVRVKKIDSKKTRREYLQIVESFRNGKAVRQRVLFSLGRMDQLKNSGQIDGLIQSLARFSETLRVEKTTAQPTVSTSSEKIWGPSLVFNRLWENQQFPKIINSLVSQRNTQFNLERALFAKVLHRLCNTKRTMNLDHWLETTESAGFEYLSSMHFIHTTSILSKIRNNFENELYDRDLEQGRVELDTIFLYTFLINEPENKTPLPPPPCNRKQDQSKEICPDLLVVATDGDGWPLGWEVVSEEIDNIEVFKKIVRNINSNFSHTPIVIVADQGTLPDRVSIDLLGKRHMPIQYVIGYRAETTAMVDMLAAQPYSVVVDEQGIESKALLLTDMAMPGNDVTSIYQNLSQIQRFFQDEPHLSNLTPNYNNKATIKFDQYLTNFIALRLKVDLQHRLKKENIDTSWAKVMRDLKQLKVLQMDIDGKPFHLRSDFEGSTDQILKAVDIHIPNRVSAL
jgi:hypothetical protein